MRGKRRLWVMAPPHWEAGTRMGILGVDLECQAILSLNPFKTILR